MRQHEIGLMQHPHRTGQMGQNHGPRQCRLRPQGRAVGGRHLRDPVQHRAFPHRIGIHHRRSQRAQVGIHRDHAARGAINGNRAQAAQIDPRRQSTQAAR